VTTDESCIVESTLHWACGTWKCWTTCTDCTGRDFDERQTILRKVKN